jgi:hypothetical protein
MEALKGALLIVTLIGQNTGIGQFNAVHPIPFSTMANCETARERLVQDYNKASLPYSLVCVVR